MITLFHVTPISKVDSIMEKGLIPQIGERAKELETKEKVYLFPTYQDCQTALYQWLGDEFDELEEEVVSLKVELPDDFPLEKTCEWELTSKITIEPSCISFYKNEG